MDRTLEIDKEGVDLLMTKKPNIIINYLYNLSYQLLVIILPIITTPYISRTLKAEAIGAYSFSYSVTTYFSLFGILGLNMYGQLKISKCRDNQTRISENFFGIFIAKCITSIVSILVYLFVLLFSGKYQSLFIVLITLLVSNIFDISWLFQGVEQFKTIVLRNYIIKFFSVLLIFILVKSEKDIILYAFIMQASTLLGNLSLWLSLKNYVKRVKFADIKVLLHIKNSLVYFLPAIASSIYTSMDKIMLGTMIGSDFENGIYDQAHKIEQTVVTILSSLNMVLLPRMSYLFSLDKQSEYKKYLRNSLEIVGLLAMPMVAGLFSIANTFVPIFLGNEFISCVILLRIFSFLVLFSGVNTMIGNQCLVAQGKQNKYNIGVVVGAIINVTLNIVLIPLLKSSGAAIASVLSEIVILGIFLFYSRSYIKLNSLIKMWSKFIVASIVMAFILWGIGLTWKLSILKLIGQIIMGVMVYFVVLIILKEKNILYFMLKLLSIFKNK